jgi:cyclopropane-fatty-acyl-phospholipid synthase
MADLATAQTAKLEYVCRKLEIESGDRVLDIGCGWGGFLRYTARTRQAWVTGLTLSHGQAAHARTAVAEAGLASECEVRESHFRDLPSGETFDRVAGIGIFEHLGPRLGGDYFRTAFRALRPGGTFLNQAIACSPEIESFAGTAFIDHFVFPGAELVPVSMAVSGAEAVGFEVLDVEELRGHYERTLALWRERLEANQERAEAVVGAGTVRAFRLYFAAFQREFEAGSLRLYQVLLRKPDHAGTRPITRASWYAMP